MTCFYLINRRTGWVRWVDKLEHLTNDRSFALFTTDVVKVSKLVEKYVQEYKIYLVDKDGVVTKKYE